VIRSQGRWRTSVLVVHEADQAEREEEEKEGAIESGLGLGGRQAKRCVW